MTDREVIDDLIRSLGAMRDEELFRASGVSLLFSPTGAKEEPDNDSPMMKLAQRELIKQRAGCSVDRPRLPERRHRRPR